MLGAIPLRLDRMSQGRLLRLAWIGLVVVACAPPPAPTLAPTPVPVPTSTVDPTSILLIDVGEEIQTGPLPRRLANAFGDAMLLAETNGEDLGYPWVDPVTGELVLSVVTPRGRELVEAAGITVPHRMRDVAHGVAELQRILDEVILLGEQGVADADLVAMTLPDLRDNRALIVITAMSEPLLDYLAQHYPIDAIAVQVDPDAPVS
jgi:hypothetical protein